MNVYSDGYGKHDIDTIGAMHATDYVGAFANSAIEKRISEDYEGPKGVTLYKGKHRVNEGVNVRDTWAGVCTMQRVALDRFFESLGIELAA